MSLIRMKVKSLERYLWKLNFCGNVKNINYCANGLNFIKRFNSTQSSSANKLSYFHQVGNEPLIFRTIGQQLTISAEKYTDREALVSCHENKRITFMELKERADQAAAGFKRAGLNKGDSIGIWAPNTANWLISMMGASRAGLVMVALNPAFQAREMEFCLKKVGVNAIVASEGFKTQNYYEMLSEIIPEMKNSKPGQIESKKLPNLKTVIIDSERNLAGAFKFNEICFNASPNEINVIESLQNQIDPDSPCNMQFTSGTTGNPKATVLSHFNFINNSYHIGLRNELNTTPYKKTLMQVPFFHAFGIVIATLAGIQHGSTLVLPGLSFNPKESIDAIIKEKCNLTYGTPTMYVDLVNQIRENNVNFDSNVEIAVTGGAPCSPKLFTDIKNTLGVKKLKTVFGLTETTAVICQTLRTDNDEKILETVGHIQEHTEAKVIDENGNTVKFGEPGELCVRGYATMLGYFNDVEKTKEIIDNDKWLKTGDQFVLYENGYGKIVGRLKDMILRGGENIFPKEIEDFLNTHSSILESHVVGIPDERLGEEVCAFIRLKDQNQTLTYDNLKLFCTGKMAHFKIPRYIQIVDSFPKTASGKVQKFKLINEFQRSISC